MLFTKYTCKVLLWSGLKLSPLDMSAIVWPIVPAPGHIWVWSSRWNETWQKKPKHSAKTYPSATLPIKNPTWPDLGWTPGRSGGDPATDGLSYGTGGSIDALPPYCLQTSGVPALAILFGSVQIRAINTILLSWSVQTSSTFTSWKEPSKYTQTKSQSRVTTDYTSQILSIHPSTHPPIHPSIHLPTYIPIYGSTALYWTFVDLSIS
jgi:hypothetical protein